MRQFKDLSVLLGIVFFMQNAVLCRTQGMSSSTASTTVPSTTDMETTSNIPLNATDMESTTTMDNPTTSTTVPTTTSITTSQAPTHTTTTSQTLTTSITTSQAPTHTTTTSQTPTTSTTTSQTPTPTTTTSQTPTTSTTTNQTPTPTTTTIQTPSITTIISQTSTSQETATNSTTSQVPSSSSTTSGVPSSTSTAGLATSTFSASSDVPTTTSTTSHITTTTETTSQEPTTTLTTSEVPSTSSTTSEVPSTTSTTSPASTTTSSTSQASSPTSTTTPASSTTLTTSLASSTTSTTSPASSMTSTTSPASSTTSTTSPASSTTPTTSPASTTISTTSQASSTSSTTSPASSTTSSTSPTSSTTSTSSPASPTISTTSLASTTTSSVSSASSTTSNLASTTTSATSPAPSTTSTTSPESSTTSTTSPASSTTSTTSPASSTTSTTSAASSTTSTTSSASSTTSTTSPASSTTSTTSPASSMTSTTSPASTMISTTSQASSTSSTTSPASSTTLSTSPTSSTTSTTSPASSTTSTTSSASSTTSTTSLASSTSSTTSLASSTFSTTSPASSTTSTSSPASSATSTTSLASTTTSTTSPAPSTTSTTSPASSSTSTTSPPPSTTSTTSPASSTTSTTGLASSTTSTTSPVSSTTSTTSSASSTTSTTSPASSTASTTSPASTTISTTSPASSTTLSTSPTSSTTSTSNPASPTISTNSLASTTTSTTSPAPSTTSTSSPASSSTSTTSSASSTTSTTSSASSTTSTTSLASSTTSTTSPASSTTSTTSPASSTTSTISPASSTTSTSSPVSSTTSTTSAASSTTSTLTTASSNTSTTSPTSTTTSTSSPASTITSTSSTSAAASTTSTLPTTSTVITTVPTNCGFPYSYGPSTDFTMPKADEWCRGAINVNFRVPFRGQKYRNIYVCPNGIVCFGKKLQTYFIPRNGEFRYSFLGRSCLAPYFSDLATYWEGDIYYRYIDALDNTTAPEIDVARAIVQQSQGLNIQPTFILITTWDQVAHYYSNFYYRYRGTVTFQVVYITDGTRSYSFYYYEEGSMNIQYGRVFIGLIEDGRANGFTNSRDGSFLRQPDKNLFSGDCYGQYEYIDSESDDIDSELVCRQWHSRELNNLWLYNFYLNRMPECPCFSWFLFFDRRFSFSWWLWWTGSDPTFSAYVRPSRRFSPYGKTCEYDRFRGTFIRVGNSAGSFTRYHPLTNPQRHYSEDLYYKRMCCEEADLCDLYFHVRPQHTCYRRFPFRFSWAFGDPHITTLDNRTYTFNGHDEYVLLNVTTEIFQIQCRTDRGFRADGNTSLATVFTGFVVSGDSVWMQAELDANRTGLIVYAGDNKTNFDDYTDAFNNDSLSISDIDLSEKLSLERSGDTLMSTFIELGISFNVTLGKKLLQLGIGLPENLKNQTEGLLGNFNNNPDDDFIPRFTDQPLAYNSTERTIFEQFGQTWKTTEEESIFKYDDGKTRANYSTDFVPNFIEEADPVLVQQAEEKCGQGQAQCVFDFVFTGDEEIADSTLSTQNTADVVTAEASNEVPAISIQSGLNLIDGQGYLYTNLKENSSFNVLGEDDGMFTYEILSNSSFASINTKTNDSATVTVYLNSTEPRNLSITVADNQNVYAEAINVIIVLCTGCSEHGSCDFTTFRQDNVTTETFKIATCNCLEYWEGDDCEIDYDGCQDDPCAVGRNCTDKNATFHQAEEQEQNDTRAYTCEGCPLGYLIDPDEKCEDIDECNTTNGNCSQTCTNTEGSFSCSCNSTYRLGFDGQTCDDINECEEATSGCDQICNNTVGGFKCECYEGYIYNTSTSSCEQTNSLQTECSMINCSNADGCTLNSTNDAVCFCNSGFDLQNDGSCTDIDECAQNVCSQGCTNTQGSYNCTCYTGFKLSSDKISCEECDFPNYGENCASTCECGRGNDGCDNVRGCICKNGWTGTNCDTDIDECVDPNICGDINKVCTNTVGSYICNCRSGYSLQANGTCSDTDECTDASLNTCAQQCINTIGGFVCGCRDGYTLDESNATQCSDIDECASGVSACEQTCINTKGSYRCECFLGFVLNDDRRKCTKVSDPCTLFPEIQCSDICRVIDQQPMCSCNVGFELGADNQTCIDINECDSSLDLNKCTEKDTCVNIRGKYECFCSLGYQLGQDQRTCTVCDEFHWGENCNNDCNCGVGAISCDPKVGCVCEDGWSGVLCDIDRNECASSADLCSGDNEQCKNTPGSYVCSCLAGYENSTNGNCENIDECETALLNQCDQICTDTVGSYTCSCRPGFTQNGTSCADIDECTGQHGCSQVCSNTQGSYRCTCKEGFKLELSDRKTCIPSSICQDETFCGNNSVCTSIDGVDTCECDKGYKFAENSTTTCIDIQECSLNPEQCSQACVEQDGGYACVCNETGYKLDVDLSSCIVCDHGSYGDNCTGNCTCVESNTARCNNINGSCTCKNGWTGDTCDSDVDECETDDICPLNSSCLNSMGSYSCQCDPGFLTTSEGQCQSCTGFKYGPDCAEECTCDVVYTERCDPVYGNCTCKAGWMGTNCADDIYECVNSTICGDELKMCVNTNGSFVCNCIVGYIKSTDGSCEDVDECAEGQGNCTFECTNTMGSFRCDCPQGQSGSGNNCTDCANNNFGTNCSTTCDCIPEHSVNPIQTCNHVDGVCGCLPMWTGVICETDVDECADNSTCNVTNGGCHNVDGGFECSCFIGYANQSNECVLLENVTTTPIPNESGDRSVSIYVVVSYSLPQTRNLQIQATYNYYVNEVESAISRLFSATLGDNLKSVVITFLKEGSLKVNSTLTYADTDDAGSQFTEVVYSLATNQSFTLLNETVYPQALTVGNKEVTINDPPSRCELFEEIHGCNPENQCTEAGGTVVCQSDSSSDNSDLIIGLSVGLSVFLVIVLFVTVVVIFVPVRKIWPLSKIHNRVYR